MNRDLKPSRMRITWFCFLHSAISIPRVSVTGEQLPTTRHISGKHHRDMVSDTF